MICEPRNRRSDTSVGVQHSWVWARQDSGVECKAWHLHVVCIRVCGERGGITGRIYCFCQVYWETLMKCFPVVWAAAPCKPWKRSTRTENAHVSHCERFMWANAVLFCFVWGIGWRSTPLKTHMLQILINQHKCTLSDDTQRCTLPHRRHTHAYIFSRSLNLGSVLQSKKKSIIPS